MLTPPPYRTKLPTSSPSSARLRRLAPSPVKVPPTPPLYVSPARFSASPNHSERSERGRPTTPGLEDPFEYDFAPLEQLALNTLTSDDLNTSCTMVPRRRYETPPSPAGSHAAPQPRVKRQDSTDSNVSIPLLFDARGDFGAMAERHRLKLGEQSTGPSGMDVPEELDVEWGQSLASLDQDEDLDLADPFRRIPESRSEAESMARDQPLPVLVNFKDDVFGGSTGETFRNASLPVSDTSESSFGHIGMTLDSRDLSTSESFHTFGKPGNRQSNTASIFEDDDGWSYTLSAYGDDDDEPRQRTHQSPRSVRESPMRRTEREATPFLSPHLSRARDDSPMSLPSTSSTIFTPNYSLSSSRRPDFSSGTFDYADSPVSRKPLPSLPPSPRTAEPTQSLRLQPSLSNTSNASVMTISPIFPTYSPMHLPSHNFAEQQQQQQIKKPQSAGVSPVTSPAPSESLHAQIQHNHLTVKSPPRPSTSSAKSDQSLPEIIRQALQSVPRDTTVTLMIDQEGMREITCLLNYRRSHKPQVFRDREIKALEEAALWCESPSRPEPFQQSGCIEFGVDPKSRPKWKVHHAALEGLPILSRCTVNNDEKHDYLSRGATLQIRDLGVYAVYGSEDKGRVEWKFEYLVQEKLSASTGEVKANEKLVIPLGFYVSPSFFNPDRAMKLHLVNMFKKSLTPKIVSEKVNPPRIGIPPQQPSPMPSPVPLTRPPTATPEAATPAPSQGGAISRIFRAVGSTRSPASTPTSIDPFGSKSPGDATTPSTEKKTRKRAATLFNRAPKTADPTSSSKYSSNLPAHMRPRTSQTASCPGPSPSPSSTLGRRVVAPVKSMSNIRPKTTDPVKQMKQLPQQQQTPTPSRTPIDANTFTYPGMRRIIQPMKSLSALKVDSSGRPRTADPTMGRGDVPAVPRHTGLPISASSQHPFATHVTPVTPTSNFGSLRGLPSAHSQGQGYPHQGQRGIRPATAGTAPSMHRPDVRLLDTNIAMSSSHSHIPNTSGNNINGVVLGQTVMIGQNEQMAKWTARGGFNAPRSASEDSLKVPNGGGGGGGSMGVRNANGNGSGEQSLYGMGRGLTPAPRGGRVLPGVRGVVKKRPSTAEPRMGIR